MQIARRLGSLGEAEEVRRAYVLAIHESGGERPAEELEAAAYIL